MSACTSPQGYTTLLDGTHTFSVQAKDIANNLSGVASYQWVVDTAAPPAPVIDTHPPVSSNATSAAFTFHDSEAGASFQCAVDAGAFAACTSPFNKTGLTDASHTFHVKAKDGAGNLSGATSFVWTVDTAGPVIKVNAPKEGAIYARYQRIKASRSCSDSSGVTSCKAPKGFLPTGKVGAHTYTVHATDTLGNQSSKIVHYSVKNACLMTPTIKVRFGQRVITGTAGNDVIRATRPVGYRISGRGGNDVICTGSGNDVISGGAGSDVVVSRGGADRITAGGGNDYVDAGKGADTATGGKGSDVLMGRAGKDVLHGRDHVKGNDTMNGGPGKDRCDADRRDRVVSC